MVHTLHSFAAGAGPVRSGCGHCEYSRVLAVARLSGVNGLRLVYQPYCGTIERARVTAPMGLSVCVGRTGTLRFGFRPQVDDNFDGMIDLAEW
jgi:hypothetical protein